MTTRKQDRKIAEIVYDAAVAESHQVTVTPMGLAILNVFLPGNKVRTVVIGKRGGIREDAISRVE